VSNTYREELEGIGVPPELVERMIDEKFKALGEALSAMQVMEQRHPGFQAHAPAIGRFIESDPRLKSSYDRMSAADPAGALEWAGMKYRQAHGGSFPQSESPPQRPEMPPIVPGGNSAGQLFTDDIMADRERRMRYIKMRLKQAIPDSFLNQ
jgi:hypothetical protein